MSSGNSIGIGKSSSNLSNGVGISIGISGPLAKVMDTSISMEGGNNMSSSIGVVDIASRVGGVGNVSRVVGVSSGNSIGIRKSSSYLSNSVGISIRISGPLAKVVDTSISMEGGNNMSSSIGVVDIASRVGGPM